MSTKYYHVNDEGRTLQCASPNNCRFGAYESKEAAEKAYEDKMSAVPAAQTAALSDSKRKEINRLVNRALESHKWIGVDAFRIVDDIISNKPKKRLNESVKELEETVNKGGSGKRVPPAERILPRDPVRDREINKQIKETYEIARMFDDSGLDLLEDYSTKLLSSYVRNDYDGVRSSLDQMVSELSYMNSESTFFDPRDGETVSNYVNKWRAKR